MKKFTKRKAANLREKFPTVSDEGLDLLKKMLQFNPFFRPTAEECIAHPYFDECRNFSTLKNAENRVNCHFESVRKITLEQVRAEFNNIINVFDDEKSQNASCLSSNQQQMTSDKMCASSDNGSLLS